MRFLCDIFLLAGFFYLCASDPPPVSPARNVQPPVDSNEVSCVFYVCGKDAHC